MSKQSCFLVFIFSLSFFPAASSGFINNADTSAITPVDSSYSAITRTGRNKLMSLTQQIVQGTYFLPPGEIAYGDGSGLTSSSNFTWNGVALNLGNSSSSSSSTPTNINFGGTYSNAPGQNLKLQLYNAGGDVYGFGISASQMDYTVPSVSRHVWWTGTTERMRISSDGSLGIGTSNPQAKLDVNGSIHGGDLTSYGQLKILGNNPSGTTGGGFFSNKLAWDGSNSYPTLGSLGGMSVIMFENPHTAYRTDNARPGASGRSGLRMAANYPATAYWDAGLKNDDEYEIYRWTSGSNGNQLLSINSSGEFSIPSLSNGNPRMKIASDGKLLINTGDQGDYKLQVGGDMAVLHGSSETPNMLKVGNSGYVEGRPGYTSLLELSAGGFVNNGSWRTGNSQFSSIMSMYNGNIVFTSDQNLPLNSNYTPTHRFVINANGTITIPGLSDGSGVPKMVVSTNGVLSYQNITGGGSSSLNQYHVGVGNSSNQLSGTGELTYNAGKLALQYGSNYENNVLQMGPGAYIQGRSNYNSLAELSGGSYWNGSNSWTTNSSSTTASILSLYNGEMWFHTNNGLAANSSFTPTLRMKLTTAGKLLLNTEDQGDYKLQVQGNSLNKDGTAYFMTSNPSTGPLQVIMPSGDPGAAHIVYRNPSGSHISQSFVFGEGGNAIQKGRIRAGNGGELVFESTGTQYFGYHGLADNVNMRFGGNTERMFIDGSNGQIRIGSLTAPSGTTKMVVTDQNGLLSYQDIPSGSGTVSVTSNQVAFGGTGNLITSNSNLTYDGSTFAINTANLTPSSYAQYKLAVNGNAIFTRAKVRESAQWPDYVFANNYKLPSLKEVEYFIKQHKHLPEVPSASDVKKEGIDIGDNQVLLLKKIEELTLYAIEQDKKMEVQSKSIEELKKEIELLKQLIKK